MIIVRYNSRMTGRTHDLAAVTALIGVVIVVSPPSVTLGTALAALLANQIGGIAPDIDQPTAPFWRNLPIGGFFGTIFGRILGGHRFLSHSLIGIVLFGLAAELFLTFLQPIMPRIDVDVVWWAFMIGVVSHLVMDSLTKDGVPWLLPIPVKFGLPPIKKLRIVTGKKVEVLIIFPILVIILIGLCSQYYAVLQSVVRA